MDGGEAVIVWYGTSRFANLRRGGRSLPTLSVHLDISILNGMTAQGLKTMKLKSASKVRSGHSLPPSLPPSLSPSIHPSVSLLVFLYFLHHGASSPHLSKWWLLFSPHLSSLSLLLLNTLGLPTNSWGVWYLVSSCGVRVRWPGLKLDAVDQVSVHSHTYNRHLLTSQFL